MMLSRILCAVLIVSLPLMAQESEATKRLKQRHSTEFKKDIIEVAEGVYTAIGYQVSANTMIVGDDGVIIVDPGQAVPFARPVVEEFRKISDKPIKAIIYTHSHGDHVNAAGAYVEDASGVQVWGRSNFGSEAARQRAAGFTSGVRQSNSQGFDLRPEQKIGVGIAIPPSRPPRGNMITDGVQGRGGGTAGARGRRQGGGGRGAGRLEPTHTFSEPRKKLEIAGVELELVAAPGETDDQLYVWLPKQRIVFAGDNFYKSWPNVYPLRGTARRSTRDWIASLTKMIEEDPLHVVGGHTRPIKDDAKEVLTNYRDALKYVQDETVKGAQAFKTPDQLVAEIKLPERWAKLDYLQDYYGSVEGTIRDIYAQDLGWFDGDPLTLHRESPMKQSQRMADLAGGVDKLFAKAKNLLAADDAVGAAHMAQHVVRLQPKNKAAKLLFADALQLVGERTFNSTTRNYTLSSANRVRAAAAE